MRCMVPSGIHDLENARRKDLNEELREAGLSLRRQRDAMSNEQRRVAGLRLIHRQIAPLADMGAKIRASARSSISGRCSRPSRKAARAPSPGQRQPPGCQHRRRASTSRRRRLVPSNSSPPVPARSRRHEPGTMAMLALWTRLTAIGGLAGLIQYNCPAPWCALRRDSCPPPCTFRRSKYRRSSDEVKIRLGGAVADARGAGLSAAGRACSPRWRRPISIMAGTFAEGDDRARRRDGAGPAPSAGALTAREKEECARLVDGRCARRRAESRGRASGRICSRSTNSARVWSVTPERSRASA